MCITFLKNESMKNLTGFAMLITVEMYEISQSMKRVHKAEKITVNIFSNITIKIVYNIPY